MEERRSAGAEALCQEHKEPGNVDTFSRCQGELQAGPMTPDEPRAPPMQGCTSLPARHGRSRRALFWLLHAWSKDCSSRESAAGRAPRAIEAPPASAHVVYKKNTNGGSTSACA